MRLKSRLRLELLAKLKLLEDLNTSKGRMTFSWKRISVAI